MIKNGDKCDFSFTGNKNISFKFIDEQQQLMKQDKIFEFIKKVNAISHTGVTYSKDPYALDNY